MTRFLPGMYRTFLTMLGLFLLVLSFPHNSPVRMTNVARDVYDNSLYFVIDPPLFATRILLSTSELVLILFGFGILVFTAIPYQTLRSAWRSFRANQQAFLGGAAATAALIITFLPPEPYFLSEGPAAVLYLLIASLGLLFLLVGTFPLINKALEHNPLASFVRSLYRTLRRAVLDSPRLLFLATLALLEFLFAGLISHFVFENIPHVQDSIAQLFHAKIVAAGSLTAPSPPLREFFDYLTIINDGQWYSQYPPGHTVLLAIGVVLGIPWAINPLLGSLTIVSVYFLGKELYGEVIGRLSGFLALLSPFILFMSSEFMNHSSSLLFATIFLLFFVRSLRTGKFIDGLIAGAALGYMVCVRPYTAAAVATPVLLYGLLQLFRKFRELKRPAIGFLLSGIVFLGLLLGFNDATNGDPFLFGYEKLWGPQVGVGFGKGPWGAPHTAMNGLQQTLTNLNGISNYLFEWPVPSLLFVSLLFFTGRPNRWDALLVSIFACTSLFYFFYWFYDWCFGPRFLFEASSGLIILTARGIEQIPVVWRDVLGFATSRETIRVATSWIFFVLFGLGFVTNVPPLIESYGNKYWDVDAQLLKTVEERGIDRAIVFVGGTYGNGFIGNDPFLRNTVIYVRDLGDKNRRMMELYPEYEYYLAASGSLERLPPHR